MPCPAGGSGGGWLGGGRGLGTFFGCLECLRPQDELNEPIQSARLAWQVSVQALRGLSLPQAPLLLSETCICRRRQGLSLYLCCLQEQPQSVAGCLIHAGIRQSVSGLPLCRFSAPPAERNGGVPQHAAERIHRPPSCCLLAA